ncbi:hypothetical protein H0E87_011755, partial [Populus deltoides]
YAFRFYMMFYIVVKGARQLQVIMLGMGFEWEGSDERDVLRDEIDGREENEGLDRADGMERGGGQSRCQGEM